MGMLPKKHTNATLSLTSKELNQRGLILSRLGQLLEDGFSLREALTFLETIADKKSKPILQEIIRETALGIEFSTVLKQAGFPDSTCSQIYFSLYHGQFAQAVYTAGKHLIQQAEKKKKLKAVTHYPVMLLLFITMMLFAMRYILIPHIEHILTVDRNQMPFSTRFIVQAVYQAPLLIMGSLVGLTLSYTLFRHFLDRKKPLDRLTFLSQFIPLSLFKLYWTQFFAHEWGTLLKSECSLLEVISIMKGNNLSPLINEMGRWIESEMKKGQQFHEALSPLSFFKPELIEVIRHGEITGNVGYQLELYAEHCEEEMDKQIEAYMERIQPFIFIFVAVIIIAIYAALLLPTFSLMDTL